MHLLEMCMAMCIGAVVLSLTQKGVHDQSILIGVIHRKTDQVHVRPGLPAQARAASGPTSIRWTSSGVAHAAKPASTPVMSLRRSHL